MISPQLIEQVKRHEGYRRDIYVDTAGHRTVGYGHNLDARPVVQGVVVRAPVGLAEAEALLQADLADTKALLGSWWPWFASMPDGPRRDVLLNMAFNLGVGNLLNFHLTIAAVERGDWDGAARQMLQSRWANQVGARAVELAAQMRDGVYNANPPTRSKSAIIKPLAGIIMSTPIAINIPTGLIHWRTTVAGAISGLIVALPDVANAIQAGHPVNWQSLLLGVTLAAFGWHASDGQRA